MLNKINKFKAIIFLTILLASGSLFSQGMSTRPTLKLSCEHLSAIQEFYVKDHITVTAINKNLEKRVSSQFLKILDSSKIYFHKADVNWMRNNFSGVFKNLKLKKCNKLYDARKLYIQRVEDRVNFAKAHLNKKFKFNKKTKIILDADERKYPRTKKAADAYQKKYIQYQISSYLSIDKTLDESKALVLRSYDRLLKRVKALSDDDLFSHYLNAFAHSLDPHSTYFSADAMEDFKIQMGLQLKGIGATLSSRDGFTVVEQLIPGGPAFKSNELKPKDKIIAVAQGKKGKFDDVIEMELRNVVRKIRGPKGTIVRLKVVRQQKKKKKKVAAKKAAKKEVGMEKKVDEILVSIVRDEVKLEDDAATIEYVNRKIKGQDKLIGLITLPSFYADGRGIRSSAKDMKRILREANSKKVDGIVLDLSRNGGGSLRDAVKIAGLFFKRGNVVKQSQKFLFKKEITLSDKDPAVDWDGPLVILVSRVSASASEIVSGTLKDYQRAIVVGGDHTFGKGSVQAVNDNLPEGLGGLKTTVGMFFTAGGFSTQHRGVDSDIVFPSPLSNEEIGEKTLEYSLPPKKLKPFLSSDAYVAPGEPGYWDKVTPRLIKRLKKKSQKRISKSKEFKKIVKEIRKNKKQGKVISVSEVLEPSEEDKGKTKEQLEEERNRILSKKEKLKKYMERADIQESLNIMIDYISSSQNQKLTTGW